MKPCVLAIMVLTLLASAIGGCSRPVARRHHLTGTVTCGGAPVVAGEVLFTPDGSRQNHGPQGIATIREGRFDTSGTRAPGVAGGAMIVRVAGALDTAGEKIVKHEFTIELPHSDHDFAIEIPAATAVDAGPEI